MKLKHLLFLAFLCLCMMGCGRNKQLDEYMDNMTAFTTSVLDITARLEQIDTGSENAADETLACLDEMDAQFVTLAAMDVPKEFASVESLADEASKYMSEAVTLYHDILSSEAASEAASQRESLVNAAQENYDRAMKRISYISTLLQGELPQGDDVLITEEEVPDFVPVTEESDS